MIPLILLAVVSVYAILRALTYIGKPARPLVRLPLRHTIMFVVGFYGACVAGLGILIIIFEELWSKNTLPLF